MELAEKFDLMKNAAQSEKSRNPVEIAKNLMRLDFVSIHGPEHHFLDGLSILAALKNAGEKFDFDEAAKALAERASKMPGAMCGHWGICGSVASVAAAFSILHQVSPISDSQFYKDDLEFSSSVLKKMSEIGGPRCCKRNAFLSISEGAKFANEKYGTKMEIPERILCEFLAKNPQCIGRRCPFCA